MRIWPSSTSKTFSKNAVSDTQLARSGHSEQIGKEKDGGEVLRNLSRNVES